MFDLTLFDYIYIGVIFISTVWATIRGGVYETVATISWVAAAIIARFVSPLIDGVLQNWFSLSESTVGTLIASYALVFLIVLILFGLVNNRIRDRIQESMMKLTDHTLGVIFGIIRGIIVMGLVYWGMLWYYSDKPSIPTWMETARTRPIVQFTAIKIHEWLVAGQSDLLTDDMSAEKTHQNLINPAIEITTTEVDLENANDTGYKNSERSALENQLLQIKTTAEVAENIATVVNEIEQVEKAADEKNDAPVAEIDTAKDVVNDMSLGMENNQSVATIPGEDVLDNPEPTPFIYGDEPDPTPVVYGDEPDTALKQ